MRPRGSVAGPLILIAVGTIFLIHTIAPNFAVGDFVGRNWPYLLIIWGVGQLFEILVRAVRGAPIPTNGISAGGWVLVVLICFVGLGTFTFHQPDNWWRRAGFEQSVEVFGDEHDYSVDTQRKAVGKAPHIVIESFRGNAHIVGSDTTDLQLSGHKSIRALELKEAEHTNQRTPVEILVNGDLVTVRCNQNKADSRTRVSTDLELTVPRGASIEATGRTGDFDISVLAGNVDISSENAGIRLADVEGNVKIDTRHGDLVRCSNVKGTVDLRGHGTDIELEKIAGEVTVSGDYRGAITLRDVSKPIRLESMQTELNLQRLPGVIKLERGNLTAQNLVGPVQLTTRSTDVDFTGFTEGLDVTVEKGDIDLKPGNVPVGKMIVRTRSGNINLALPPEAKFQLMASTDRGEIDNEFGAELKSRTHGHGASLEGMVGAGPDLSMATSRGTITVRKSTEDTSGKKSQDAGSPSKAGKIPVGQQVEL
jgi:DUF4097 and DUF4098 domain-containing protein YvlB